MPVIPWTFPYSRESGLKSAAATAPTESGGFLDSVFKTITSPEVIASIINKGGRQRGAVQYVQAEVAKKSNVMMIGTTLAAVVGLVVWLLFGAAWWVALLVAVATFFVTPLVFPG